MFNLQDQFACPIEIKTVKDVQDFFLYVIKTRKVSFHPDNDFTDYVNLSTNEKTFSGVESQLFDKLLADCFQVCSKENIDIYSIAISCMA